jgi:hypothetical protein
VLYVFFVIEHATRRVHILGTNQRHAAAVLTEYAEHYVRHEAPLTMWR